MTGRYASHTGLQHSYWMQGQAGGLPLGFSTIGDHFKALNYSTHFVGKWHLGFESWAYTPIERGFDSYYGYLGGGEDYFTHMSGGFVDFTADRDAVLNASGAYSTELFTNRSIDRILAHAAENEGSDPFFLLLAMQAIHSPLEAPAEWVSKYDWITNKDRRTLAGMTSCLDYQLSRVASTLQDVGMWNNTIFVFTADNGGPPYVANSNWPMRGGKWTMWEGGTHITGVIHSPSHLPAQPKNFTGLVHQADWVPTLLGAAGVELGPHAVAGAGPESLPSAMDHSSSSKHGVGGGNVPPLDGMNLWPFFSDATNVTGPRTSVLLNVDVTNNDPNASATPNDLHGWAGYAGIRVGNFKLVLGDPGTPNSWCWPNQQNGTGEGHSERPAARGGAPLYPPATFEARGELREGLCPSTTLVVEEHSHRHSAPTVEGCPATDYAKCTCSYNGTVPDNRDRPLLFDLEHDPTESINLANDPAFAETLAELKTALDVYITSAVKPLNELPSEREVAPGANPEQYNRTYWAPWR
eukprot:INCI16417.4.p1 GENE.INCI16417.4~~INCI16417.4.p1  ORF type:complete len:615 (+),score=98.04 INCI16417.4:276-1847(+)